MLLIYLIGVVLAYGATFAELQIGYPYGAKERYWRDFCMSLVMSLFSWIALICLANDHVMNLDRWKGFKFY